MSGLDPLVWNRLKTTPPKGETLTARIAFPDISMLLLAAIDADGQRHFLIPLSPGEADMADNQSRGLSVTCKDLVVRGQEKEDQSARYMDIACEDAAGQEAFDIIGRDVASALSLPDITKSEAVSSVLARWRYFWGRPAANLLSREEITGLFAELWCLNYWILPHMQPVVAVSGWRGPRGSRHDFEWQGKSIEVKGTMSAKGRIHWINGIDQLLPPERGKLYFFSLRVREEGGASNTLPSLIASCRDSLTKNEDALSAFENSLVLTGYSPMHDDEYAKIRFHVIDEALYEVRDSFPRITSDKFQGGVPSGVETVQYEINLDGHDDLIVSRKPGADLLK